MERRRCNWRKFAVYYICTILCNAQKVIFVERDVQQTYSIYNVNVETKVPIQYNISSLIYPIGVDYDSTSGTLYWTEDQPGRKGIWSFKEGGGQVTKKILAVDEVSIIDDVAVDPISNLLYFTDRGKNVITVARLNDARLNAPIVTDVGEPRSLILDYQSRKLYWTDWSRSSIECSDTDGGNRTVLVSTNISKPMSIALDKSEGDDQLYWIDAGLNLIDSYNLRTGVRKRILSQKTSDSTYYGLAVGKDFIFYTATNRRYLNYVNKTYYSDDGQWSTTAFNSLYAIKYISNTTKSSVGNNSCSIQNGGCEGLCIPTAIGRSCRCHSGKRLLSNKTSCTQVEARHGPNILYLTYFSFFFSYSRVQGIVYGDNPSSWFEQGSAKQWSRIFIRQRLRGLTFDYRNEAIYMTDTVSRSIKGYPMNGSVTSWNIYNGVSSLARAVAVDWINGNIYWADQNYEHIVVAKLQPDTNITKTVINTGLDRPISLAVYPSKGKLYWSDYGSSNNRIESSNLDGTNRVTIYKASTSASIKGIAIDFVKDRIIFTNGQAIYRMNLDGSNVTTVYSSNFVRLYDVAVFEDLIFATDQIFTRILMFKEGVSGFDTLTSSAYVYDIIMYHAARQPWSPSPCKNKTCSQLCIAVALTVNSDMLVAKCLCRDGETLDSDGTSCIKDDTPILQAFVYSAGDRICFVNAVVDASYKLPHKANDICWIRNINFDFRHLAIDVYSHTLFFYNHHPTTPTIRKVSLVDKAKTLTRVLSGVGNVTGIAVDWVADHLYWTDKGLHQIWVSNLDGTAQKMLMKDLKYPTRIAVSPPDGVMYWIDEMEGSIYKANLDGTEMSVFVSGLVSPTDLTIDFMESRLLFINNNKTSTVEAVNFLGRNRQLLFIPGQNVSSIAIYKSSIALTLLDKTGVLLTNTSGAYDYQIVNEKGTHNYQYDVLAIDKAVQPLVAGRCTGNHGCEQLCLLRPGGYTCSCTDGMKLASDNKKCVSVEVMLKNFFLVGDDYRHELYQVDKNLTKISAVGIPRDDRPIDVAYDPVDKMVYWSNYNTGTIRRKPLNGSLSSVQTIRNSYIRNSLPTSRGDGIAIDSASRLLYYTDLKNYTVGVMSLDGKFSKVLIKNVYHPRAILVDPAYGVMYYTTRSRVDPNRAGIWRANMDGTNQTALVTEGFRYPNGLAIDHSVQRIYWIDGDVLSVGSARLDGTHKKIIHTLEDTNTFGLALIENSVYTGYMSVAKGHPCQRWDTNYPHVTNSDARNPGNFPESTIAEASNYCRNPDNEPGGPWCFLNDTTPGVFGQGSRWQYCDIPGYNDSLYYTDWKQRGIFKISRDEKKKGSTVFGQHLFNGLNGLKYFAEENRLVTACSVNNGNCSQLCLPTPIGRTCACKGITRLKPDGLSCFDEVTCPHSIPNGNLTSCSDSWNIDSRCKVACDTNLKPRYPNDLKCSRSSEWYLYGTLTYPNIQDICVEQICGKLLLSTSSGLVQSGNCSHGDRAGSRCMLQCDQGYYQSLHTLHSSKVVVCNSSLQWTSPSISCDSIKCDPYIASNVILTQSCTRLSNRTCDYKCTGGYDKTYVRMKLECNSTGSWQIEHSMCKRYSGNFSEARGHPCQRWDSSYPHQHSQSAITFPDATLSDASNYCRNPDNEPGGPWCYLNDTAPGSSGGSRWLYCDIPGYNVYSGDFSESKGRTCQRWDTDYPHSRSYNSRNPANFPETTLAEASNYCRNPDHDPDGPWCYLNDTAPSSVDRWDYCDIPGFNVPPSAATISTTIIPSTITATTMSTTTTTTTAPPSASTTVQTTIGFDTSEHPIGTGARTGGTDDSQVVGLAVGLTVAIIVMVLVAVGIGVYFYKRRASAVKYDQDILTPGNQDSVAYENSSDGNLAFDNPVYTTLEKKGDHPNDTNENFTSEMDYDNIKLDMSHT